MQTVPSADGTEHSLPRGVEDALAAVDAVPDGPVATADRVTDGVRRFLADRLAR